MMAKFRKVSIILASIPIAFSVSSCSSNFESVEKFGEKSSEVKKYSGEIAQDFYGQCMRKARYTTSEAFPAIIATRATEEKKCDEYLNDVGLVSDANTVLVDYMVGLGKLANNNNPSFDENLTALETSLKKLNSTIETDISSSIALKEEEVNAGLKIARFIFNQLVLSFRRENIKDGILCSDQYVQIYTPGLVSLVEEYTALLATEKNKIDSYYTKYTPTPERRNQVLALFTFEQNYNREIDKLNNKKQAANAYIEILKQTAKMHSKLKEEFNDDNMSDEAIDSSCQEYFVVEKSETEEKEVNSINPIDIEEAKKVAAIITEYSEQVEPLIEQLERGFD